MPIFPDLDIDNRKDNPMNLILPGYETLWRVVLRCYLELTSRQHGSQDEWQRIVQAFADRPTPETLGMDKTGLTAKRLAREALRLYPPTRRVYREYQDGEGQTPERWVQLETANQMGKIEIVDFMPFGTKPFMCPAKRSLSGKLPFGYAMVALLVGVLVKETRDMWEVQSPLPAKEIPLATGREDYADLLLSRVF
ncbi:hypothetical protein LTR37_009356 [Vermiconidia calcicola]|uniref:Uncharacterized protein n=1 Tax=Vermiconidia calcicola TaxID=1690605 RepID=A0ACC3N852_9PEZI|nr:hypothetical protein LTR37_009356 [Vermiconidia calcicola]